MELNLEEAREGPVDLSHCFSFDLERLERPEVVSLAPVEFRGRLTSSEVGFVVTGSVRFSGSIACSRCLTPVNFEGEEPVSWVFSPEPEPKGATLQDEVLLNRDDFDIVHYREPRIFFDPFIEEELQLEIPLKPLCGESCKGICPACGADRNNTECGCAVEEDSRWGALKVLTQKKGR
jgi:uncharacterized protein